MPAVIPPGPDGWKTGVDPTDPYAQWGDVADIVRRIAERFRQQQGGDPTQALAGPARAIALAARLGIPEATINRFLDQALQAGGGGAQGAYSAMGHNNLNTGLSNYARFLTGNMSDKNLARARANYASGAPGAVSYGLMRGARPAWAPPEVVTGGGPGRNLGDARDAPNGTTTTTNSGTPYPYGPPDFGGPNPRPGSGDPRGNISAGYDPRYDPTRPMLVPIGPRDGQTGGPARTATAPDNPGMPYTPPAPEGPGGGGGGTDPGGGEGPRPGDPEPPALPEYQTSFSYQPSSFVSSPARGYAAPSQSVARTGDGRSDYLSATSRRRRYDPWASSGYGSSGY